MKVTLYHPELNATITCNPSAARVYMRNGWVDAADHYYETFNWLDDEDEQES